MTTAELQNLDKQHIWHPFTPMKLWLDDDPLVIVAAEGMHLIDSDGNRYLDGISSLWCNVHGHRVPEIDAAIRAQLDKVAHSTLLGLANEPSILLANRLMKIVPAGLSKIFYSDSGATATEIAFKLAAQYWYNTGKPEKNEFIGFADAYHGDTVGAMSVGRMETFHRPYFPLLFKVHFVAIALDALEKTLAEHAKKIAAICIEPIVQGAGGILIQPEGFLRGIRELANKYDVLLIADEVATGFGRTGKMFACEHENVSPDLMCIGKGITGGYMPLAATFATQRIFDAFLGEPHENKTFFHGHTYTGNPLACAAAIASLELFEKNKLLARVQEKSQRLAEMLKELPDFVEVRQKGLMCGIELKRFDPKLRTAHRICKNLRRRGVILRPLGDVIILMPPLAMGVDDLTTIMRALNAELRMLKPLGIPGLLITGTDTGIGKTVVAGAIARWFRLNGKRVAVCKPCGSGCVHRREGLVSEDAEFLAHCADARAPLHIICPQRYAEALAPGVAGPRVNQPLDWSEIQRAIDEMSVDSDVMVIEGVGGIMVPMDDEHTMLDVAEWLKVPAVVVARAGLGTINHTLLTVDALRSRGVRVAGVVINEYPAENPGVAEETNPKAIEKWGKVPVLCVVPEWRGKMTTFIPEDIGSAVGMVDWGRILEIGSV